MERERERLILWDSDTLIELFAGNPTAIKFYKASGQIPFYNAISYAELIRGAGNNAEKRRIQQLLTPFHLIDIDAQVCSRFYDLVDFYALSHGLQIPDALIAATAVAYDMMLATCNRRHFTFINGLELAEHKIIPVRRKQ